MVIQQVQTGRLPVIASSGNASAGLGAEPIGKDPKASNNGSEITDKGVPPSASAKGRVLHPVAYQWFLR